MPYTIINATITPQRTSVRIDFQLNEAGIFQCGVYLSTASSPLSLYNVISQGHFSSFTTESHLLISGLVAVTDYKLFCLTKSDSSVLTTSYLRMMENEMTFTTLCCRHITVDLAVKDVSSEVDTLNVMKLTWDALPARDIYVNFTTNYRFNASKPFEGIKLPFQPTSFALKTTRKAVSFSAAIPAKSLPGEYFLDFNYSSWDSDELAKYEVVYTEQSPKLTVIDDYEPPVPNISASYFSDDGIIIYIYFDSATDIAKQGFGLFACSKVVNFPSASTSECVWESETLLHIYSDITDPLKVGDSVNLVADTIKAKCTSTAAVCENWAYASGNVYYTIETAIDAVVPQPNIDAAKKIGSCDKFVLDLSLAAGSGGRDWSVLIITVTSPNGYDVSRLMDFYNHTYVQSPPTPADISLFELRGIYEFDVYVCNFLGKCSSSGDYKHTVEYEPVTRPIAYFLGDTQTLKARNRLTVKCVAYVRTCSGDMYNSDFFIADARSTANLSYAWTIFRDGDIDHSFDDIMSATKGPELSLAPYSLSVDGVYVINLEVTYLVTDLSTTDTLDVIIKSADLRAVIGGGKEITLPLGTSTLLDGSSSEDGNIDPSVATGVAAGLSFEWSCFLSSPLDVDDCGVILEAQSSADIIKITPIDNINSDYINSTSTITLTVYDDSGRRPSSATVEVSILPGDAPVITLSAEADKILPSAKLKLFSNVQINSSTVMTWTVDNPDINSVLSDISLTPLVRAEESKGSYQFNLVLKESVLPIRGTLSFSLDAGSSRSSIDIVIISPPIPGRMVISPLEGEEMSDTFDIGTSLWTDIELPITYAFGYITLEGSRLPIQPRSEDTYADSTLPAGSPKKNNLVTVYVRAFNPLEASDLLSVTTTVTKIQATVTQFSDIVAEQLAEAADETDSKVVKKIVNVASSSMNNVNCSKAPNCTALNRGPCVKLADTCGKCLSSYVGEDGHDNSKCFSSSKRNVTNEVNSTCQADADCALFQECDTSTSACYFPPKTCKFDCSGVGNCTYKNVKNGRVLDTCVRGDTSCVARCSCNDGYAGETCELSQAEQEAKLRAREDMAVALRQAVETEPLNTPDSVQDLISMIEVLSANPFELTVAACESLASMVELALSGISSLNMQYEDVAAIYQTLDDCQTVYIDNGIFIDLNGDGNNGTRRALAASGSLNALINEYAAIVSNGIEGGQDLVGEASVNFRTTNFFSNDEDVLTFNVAQTDAEIASNAPNSWVQVYLGQSGTDSELSTALVESAYQIYSSSEEESILANPIKISFSRSSISDMVTLQFNLVNVVGEMEYGEIRTTNETFKTHCSKGTYKLENYTCESGYVLENECAHNSSAHHTLTTNCPNSTYLPVCGLILENVIHLENPDSFSNVSCSPLSYTNESVVCECQLYLNEDSDDDTRRLATDESNTIEVVSIATFVADGVVNTVYEVTEIIDDDSMIIITMVICLWCVGLLFVVLFSTIWYGDVRRKDQQVGILDDIQGVVLANEKSYVIESYVDSIFPPVFMTQPRWSWTDIRREMQSYHRYVAFFTSTSEFGSRSTRLCSVLELLTLHTTVYFLLGVFFVVQFPVNEAADSYFSAADMFIAIFFVVVIHAFINYPVSVLFQDYLSAPDARVEMDEISEAGMLDQQSTLVQPNEKLKSSRLKSTTGGYVTDESTFSTFCRKNICRLETTRRLPENHLRQHRKMTALGNEGLLRNHSESGIATKKDKDGIFDHLELVSIVNMQREFLLSHKPEAVDEFDTKWGLNLKKFNLEETARVDIERSVQLSNQKAMKLHLARKENIGVEIIQEFVVDTLGRDTFEARIFLRKVEEDFRHLNVVSAGAKTLMWLVVLGLNIYFLYFLISLGVNRSRDFQLNFVTVCMVQLFLEIVLFETMEVVWVQYVIPRTILEHVQVKIEFLKSHLKSGITSGGEDPLNASNFFFVSTRLAKKFPTLFESELVLLFKSYLPLSYGDRWHREKSWIPWNLSNQVGVRFLLPDLVILQYIGVLSMRVQKLIVRLAFPIFVLLVILFVTLPVLFVILAVILFCFLLLHICLMLKRKKATVIYVEEPAPRAMTPPRVETPPREESPRVETPPKEETPRVETPPKEKTPRVETPPPALENVPLDVKIDENSKKEEDVFDLAMSEEENNEKEEEPEPKPLTRKKKSFASYVMEDGTENNDEEEKPKPEQISKKKKSFASYVMEEEVEETQEKVVQEKEDVGHSLSNLSDLPPL